MQILPALLRELRTVELQAAALPLVLQLLQRQGAEDFQEVTLPALKPLIEGATGDTLLQLTRSSPLFLNATAKGAAAQLVPKLLLRALQDG